MSYHKKKVHINFLNHTKFESIAINEFFFVADFAKTVTRSPQIKGATYRLAPKIHRKAATGHTGKSKRQQNMLFHHARDTSTLRKGVLLINFGTPSSPDPQSVRSFLRELFKEQDFHLPPFIQDLVVRTCILPWRTKKAVTRYRAIWTEEGSPLLVQSTRCAQKLCTLLPENTVVALGMKYGRPSLLQALEELKKLSLDEIVILPLFPQQVPAMTQAIVETVVRHLLSWPRLPRIFSISEFCKEPWYLEACAARLLEANPENYDHILFSYHALPESSASPHSQYRQDCIDTAEAIAESAGIAPKKISVAFQSKAGVGKWTSPSTQETLNALLHDGKQRVLVMCPSFVVDCIETLGEIAGECRADFLGKGGEYLGLVECLNDFSPWIEGVSSYIQKIQGQSL